MFSLLVVVLYLSFISLGLPDSLLGSAWPVMSIDLNAPLSSAGIITMIISFGTIISSLLSDKMTTKFGAGLITGVSILLTACGLIGFSFSTEFYMLCLWAIPYGIGAGAVDAALNNYVACNLSSRHMNWLHCMWGVGASISPYIMSFCLTNGFGWRSGYRTVFLIQIILAICIFFSIPLWRKYNKGYKLTKRQEKMQKVGNPLKIPSVIYVLIAFFCYCSLEHTAGLWATSYLINYRSVSEETGALFASFFYLGITVGRGFCGVIAGKINEKKLVFIGISTAIVGIILVGLPFNTSVVALIGLIVIGIGCAPIYPAIIHMTPANFGKANSQAVIGLQMACAYIGSTFMPPVFGLIAQYVNIGFYPLFLGVFAIIFIFMFTILNKKVAANKSLNTETTKAKVEDQANHSESKANS